MPDGEKGRLFEALRVCGGNRTQAARRLGIDRTTLWRNLQKYTEKQAWHPNGGLPGHTATTAPIPPEAAYGTMLDGEKDRLFEALRACGGNRTRAARGLSMDRTTLWHNIQKYIQK